ncbi:cob(I)yrinic acid a,c-diamide adenosyltransferase [Candidatus Woesearchaeota archaeon]|nr:cob(I)yrinic acid a,c-diamide adenosyltransferase [Candidatus Woesearchaeota archaeon]
MKEKKDITRLQKPVIVHGDDSKESLGLVHVYTGDGKGKTTASLGLAMRAAGNGLQVYIIQFLKACETGELHAIEKLPNITIVQFGVGMEGEMQKSIHEYEELLKRDGSKETGTRFAFMADRDEKTACQRAFDHAKKIIKSGDYDLVVLDEVNCAMNKGLVPVEEVLELMQDHGHTELVFTGWGAPERIKEKADYVSFVQKMKHPYEKGIKARRGIEY